MGRFPLLPAALAGVVLAAAATVSASTSPTRATAALQAPAPGGFVTAVVDPVIDAGGPNATTAIRRVAATTGARYLRIDLFWDATAPARPAGDASDPANPAYQWDRVDGIVREAVASRLTPVLMVAIAPRWAREDPKYLRPDVGAFAAFVKAAARRYSGSFRDLPAVRHWVVWNEPNFVAFLTPQASAVATYREMLNAAAPAIHEVSAANVVIGGALAPAVQGAISPLAFTRDLLSTGTVRFDAWAVHPYTWGGPTHRETTPDAIPVSGLPTVRTMLRAAQAAGRIESRRPVALWVTEFSYDTKPPDPNGLEPSLHTRWTSHALYEMWRSGVSVVTWFLLRDLEPPSPFQSGLYTAGPTLAADKPKPSLRAFRFPFVAFPRLRNTQVWGRAPRTVATTVVVERRVRSRWVHMKTFRTDRFGVFHGLVPGASRVGSMRARLADRSDVSIAFGLKPVPNREVSPFG